jgi:hypothetical protein
MATLTTKQRNRLPASSFAGPGRSYPVNDRAHAANAKARATQQVKRGKLSPEQASRIRKKADALLNKGGD